jgi:hypothetical protein
MAGVGLPEGQALLSELERNGVFSRDRTGTIFSRRLVKDEKKSKIARKIGKKGGNPSIRNKRGSSPSVNPLVNPQDKGWDNTHKPCTNSQKKESPAQPPDPGGAAAAPENEFDRVQAESRGGIGELAQTARWCVFTCRSRMGC